MRPLACIEPAHEMLALVRRLDDDDDVGLHEGDLALLDRGREAAGDEAGGVDDDAVEARARHPHEAPRGLGHLPRPFPG